MKLDKRKKYFQISLNSNLSEAQRIIRELPFSDRIILEAGTPLIMKYGVKALLSLRNFSPFSPENFFEKYLVADIKCADLAEKEVRIAVEGGASAATCLGIAPLETIENFVSQCRNYNLDAIVDMINVDNPFLLLQKLKNIPDIVILHRGVDELEVNKERIPYYQIEKIKGNYDVLVGVAGADEIADIEEAFFNGADIVILWKDFFTYNEKSISLVRQLLKRVS